MERGEDDAWGSVEGEGKGALGRFVLDALLPRRLRVLASSSTAPFCAISALSEMLAFFLREITRFFILSLFCAAACFFSLNIDY